MPQPKPATLTVAILVAVALGVAGFLFGTLALSGAGGQAAPTSKGPGVVYETPVPVADFTLTDQTGAPFTFSSTRGKVVLMAFLFTHCGDVCPFSAVKMRQTLVQLGDRARDVELVVVDTDPERDTVAVLAAYSRDLGLYDRWHMVTGPLESMQALYKSLKITVVKAEEEAPEGTPAATDLTMSLPEKDKADSPLFGLTDQQVLEGDAVAKKYQGGYDVAHSAPFWVVDPEGRVRASLDVSASPAQLADAVRTYLPRP